MLCLFPVKSLNSFFFSIPQYAVERIAVFFVFDRIINRLDFDIFDT